MGCFLFGSDKVRRGIKTHLLGGTGGADQRNFPGTAQAGLVHSEGQQLRKPEPCVCRFIATSSPRTAELSGAFAGGVGRERGGLRGDTFPS